MRRRTTGFGPVAAVLVVALAAAACGRPEMVQTTFTVEGMHCDGCSSAIETTVAELAGVEDVTADHEAGSAVVVYSSAHLDADDLKRSIEDLGYTVTGDRTEPLRVSFYAP